MSRKVYASVIILLIVGVILIVGGVWYYKTYNVSSTSSPNQVGENTWQPFSIITSPGFEDATTSLGELVHYDGGPAENNFCIVGYENESSTENQDYAWVYWREKDELILWEGSVDSSGYDGFINSRDVLHLNTNDVVSTGQEVPFGSTYVVTQTWVNQIMDDCWKYGNQFLIQ